MEDAFRLKKIPVTVLIFLLIFTEVFSSGSIFSAAYTITKETTTRYYVLDTGYIALWSNGKGKWQNDYVYGNTATKHSFSHTFSVPSNAVIVHSAIYNPDAAKGQAGYFPFSSTELGENEEAVKSNTNKGSTKNDYIKNYYNHRPDMTQTSRDKENPVEYKAGFPAMEADGSTGPYDLKEQLSRSDGKQFIIDMLGEIPYDVQKIMNLLDPNGEEYGEGIEGYIYFTPTVIEYTITETEEISIDPGDLQADLDIPKTALKGASYTVSDASVISEEIYPVEALLEKTYTPEDDSSWQYVTTWQGDPNRKGRNTGGSKAESESDVTTVYYRITVTGDNGQVDSKIKSIDIIDKVEDLTVRLDLPSVTYVGHPVEALNESHCYADGEFLSSSQMYARSGFVTSTTYSDDSGCSSNAGGDGKTSRKLSFSKPTSGGQRYAVTLKMGIKNGMKGTDTKEIQVLNCPNVSASLGGKQKKNRRQILNISVATHPDYPLTEFTVKISQKDGNTVSKTVKLRNGFNGEGGGDTTNDVICAGQVNKDSSAVNDKYFTNLQVEFLTKNNTEQEFTYEIYAKDSKGDVDTYSEDFSVITDTPPIAQVFTEASYLRNEKSDTADITVLDKSVTDSGDTVERTWYYREAGTGSWKKLNDSQDVKDLSFGSLKSIIHTHKGVGMLEYRIAVKDVWLDETIPRFINDSDYLTSDSLDTYSGRYLPEYDLEELRNNGNADRPFLTVVDNVAPVVSLSLTTAEKANVAVIAGNDSDAAAVSSIKNKIKEKLLENGVVGDISVDLISEDINTENTESHSIVADDSPDISSAKVTKALDFPSGINQEAYGSIFDGNASAVDNDTMYVVKPVYSSADILNVNNTAKPEKMEFYAVDAFTGKVKWQVPISKSEISLNNYMKGSARIVTDSAVSPKYVFFTGNGQTAVFEKETGAHLKTVNIEAGGDTYSDEKGHIYTIKETGIYIIDASDNGKISEKFGNTVCSGDEHYSRILNGCVNFIFKKNGRIYRGYMSLSDGNISIRAMSQEINQSLILECMGIDVKGVVLLKGRKNKSESNYDFYAADKDGNIIKTLKNISRSSYGTYDSLTAAENEKGEFRSVVGTYTYDNDTNYISYLSAFDIYSDMHIISDKIKSSSAVYQRISNDIEYAFQKGDIVTLYQPSCQYGVIGKSMVTEYLTNTAGFDMKEGTYSSDAVMNTSFLNCGSYGGTVHYSKNLFSAEFLMSGSSTTEFDGNLNAKTSVRYRTLDRALNESIASNLGQSYSTDDRKNILIVYDTNTEELTGNLSDTVKRILENRIKVIIVKESASLTGYQQQLKNEIEAGGGSVYEVTVSDNFYSKLGNVISNAVNSSYRNVLQVTKTGAAASCISGTFNLEAGRKYYYEYTSNGNVKVDIEKNETSGGEDAAVEKSGLFNKKEYRVVSAEVEDYETPDSLNDSFSYSEAEPKSAITDGRFNIISLNLEGCKSGTNYSAAEKTVTVDTGKLEGRKALLTFDVSLEAGSASLMNEILIKNNGEQVFFRRIEERGTGLDNQAVTVPLSEGVNTISFGGSQTAGSKILTYNMFIDNLALYYAKPSDETEDFSGSTRNISGTRNTVSGSISPVREIGSFTVYDISEYAENHTDTVSVNIESTMPYADKFSTESPFDNNEFVSYSYPGLIKVTPYYFGFRETNLYSNMQLMEFKNTDNRLLYDVKLTYALSGIDEGSRTGVYNYPGNFAVSDRNFLTESGSGYRYYDSIYMTPDKAKMTKDIITCSGAEAVKEFKDIPGNSLVHNAGPLSFVKDSSSFTAGGYCRSEKVNKVTVISMAEIKKVSAKVLNIDTDVYNLSVDEEYGVTMDGKRCLLYKNFSDDGKTTFTFFSDDDRWSICDFKIYYLDHGHKIYATEENIYSDEAAGAWSVKGGVLKVTEEEVPKPSEKAPLTYDKGETIVYEVHYSDYEDDPSKKSYWRYTHTPFNDGEHPDAAYIVDRYGNVSEGTGGILSEPITCFYVDGKYTVEHWQEDNTGSAPYDKESNVVSITFYIRDGGVKEDDTDDGEDPLNGHVPEVTGLTTDPHPVNQKDDFTMKASVDDGDEHDEQTVVIEVYYRSEVAAYFEKIETFRDNFVNYDEKTGSYPQCETNVIKGIPGDYRVVCTTQDDDGLDMKEYEFTVIRTTPDKVYSITGRVYHTPDWDNNRIRFNRSRFGDDIDYPMEFSEYVLQSDPKKRGTNVFWSGERFLLISDVEGEPSEVTCEIKGTDYLTVMSKTASEDGENGPVETFSGRLWSNEMKKRWSSDTATELIFIFTAYYDDGHEPLECEVPVIVDDKYKYWDYHRKY